MRQLARNAGRARRCDLDADGAFDAAGGGVARNDALEVGDLTGFGYKGEQEGQLADAALPDGVKDGAHQGAEQQLVADHHTAAAAAQVGVEVARSGHLGFEPVRRARHIAAQALDLRLRARQEGVDRTVGQTDAQLQRCTAFDLFQPQDGLAALQQHQPLIFRRLGRIEQQALDQQALILRAHQAVLARQQDPVRHINGLQLFYRVNFRIIPHAYAPFSLIRMIGWPQPVRKRRPGGACNES